MAEEIKHLQLNSKGFASASAVVFGMSYIVCAVFVLFWPGFAVTLFGWLFHLFNVEKFASGVQVTVRSFIGGLLQVVIYSYIVAWLLAWFYNKFSK